MAQRIRTIGGTGGAGGSTSTAAVTAAVVEWGPNFGSTRELAEEHTMQSSLQLATTKLLTHEERLRPGSYQPSYSLRSESSIHIDNLLGYNLPPVREEHVNRPSSWTVTYDHPAQEHAASIAFSEDALRSMTEENLLRTAAFVPGYPVESESALGIASPWEYMNNRPIHEQSIPLVVFRATFTSSTTWIVPAGLTSFATVSAFGGGGGGGQSAAGAQGGGGGGGAEYVRSTGTTVTGGAAIAIHVAAATTATGDQSWFATTATVMAVGGSRGFNGAVTSAGLPGGGGSSALGVGNNAKFSGSSGAAGTLTSGGGAGGGAGANSNGGAPSGSTGGAGGAGGGTTEQTGGAGGNGGAAAAPGSAGAYRGGGGGGAGAAGGAGGSGARGEVQCQWLATP